MALSADVSRLYVTGLRSSLLTVIDTRTWQVSNRIDLQSAGSVAVAATPGERRIYLTHTKRAPSS